MADNLEEQAELAAAGFDPEREDELGVAPSPYACPECGGVLWDVTDGDVVRFRCRVGHAYSSDSLDHAQMQTVDAALWSAIRALEERASLAVRIADRIERSGAGERAARHRARAKDFESNAEALRRLVTGVAESRA